MVLRGIRLVSFLKEGKESRGAEGIRLVSFLKEGKESRGAVPSCKQLIQC